MFLKFNYIACSPLLHIFFTYISNYQTKDIYRRRTYFFSSYFPFLNIFQVNHKSFISIYIFSLVLNMAIKIFLSSSEFIFKQRYLILAIILQELLHHFYILTNSRLFKMYLKLHRHFLHTLQINLQRQGLHE